MGGHLCSFPLLSVVGEDHLQKVAAAKRCRQSNTPRIIPDLNRLTPEFQAMSPLFMAKSVASRRARTSPGPFLWVGCARFRSVIRRRPRLATAQRDRTAGMVVPCPESATQRPRGSEPRARGGAHSRAVLSRIDLRHSRTPETSPHVPYSGRKSCLRRRVSLSPLRTLVIVKRSQRS